MDFWKVYELILILIFQYPYPQPFPDPRVDSRFNLLGCPRMTYEDDIRVEGSRILKPLKSKKLFQ
ncbi:MAG: hypothetical protein LBQ59_00230 [Candidatus Peribacteria bacterium]|nr:hypothetical protein [Candidatus Peribacteria bacterium]